MYTISSITFFRKKKIKRKQFRKKINLLENVFKLKPIPTKRVYKSLNFYKKYQITTLKQDFKTIITTHKTPMIISISQKKFNPKCTIYEKKNINTFSVGSIIKYFKVKQSKYIRRSLKGLKIFLNFLKSILEKFYLKENKKHIVFNLSGIDYNLVNLKKNIKTIIKNNNTLKLLFLLNLKVSFTKKKEKKIKAIKKRLKKKIILNFVKNTI